MQATKRSIIDAANILFYQQGYDHTSFSRIADEIHISRGNFYHHFKSKDEILEAVLQVRMSHTCEMLNGWEKESDNALDCIRRFIQILDVNFDKIQSYGCPVGTLCTELGKLNHNAQEEANQVFVLFLDWLKKQFILLGHEKEAEHLAMHLLARSQGVATLAHAFQDRDFVMYEIQEMFDWLDNINEEE